jgi:hypothetical protein
MIDWQKRGVTLRKQTNKKTQNEPKGIAKKLDTGIKLTEGRRGGYDTTGLLKKKAEKEDYEKQLEETKNELPEEIREFAGVFCQEK